MKPIFNIGDKKQFIKTVTTHDLAAFENDAVHAVYSTFAVARDAEWCCRLFALEMKEEDEEGIGTSVIVNHLAPALLNSEIVFEAEITLLSGNSIQCHWIAKHHQRVIAEGSQGQKIVKKTQLLSLFNKLKTETTY